MGGSGDFNYQGLISAEVELAMKSLIVFDFFLFVISTQLAITKLPE